MSINNTNKKKLITYKKVGKLFFVAAILVFIYSYSPYKLEFSGYYHKIWAHRANSPEKLNAALNYYPGVEIDLIYNESEDYLDVNHPFGTSIGLSFKNYLASLEKDKNLKGLWLDIKNLNADNQDIILNKITSVLEEHHIAYSNILIESNQPQLLKSFSDLGFKISYYLPNELYKKTTQELETELLKIKQALNEQPKLAISTNHDNYTIVEEHFKQTDKYIWALVWPVNIDFLTVRKLLKDNTVKVVLVNYKALKGNR